MTPARSPLPPPDPPFMVRDRFRVAADLFPLGAEYNGRLERAHFVADDRWEMAIADKLEVLSLRPDRASVVRTDDPGGLAEALWRSFGLLAADEPALARMIPEGVALPLHGIRLEADDPGARVEPRVVREHPTPLGEAVVRWLERRRGVLRLADALALAAQEDIVIMRGAPEGAEAAELLQVCFPSGWDPGEKLDAGFRSIHEPIADNARLLGSSANVMKALLTRGPYIRFAWSVTLNGANDAHPEAPRPDLTPEQWADPAEVALRTFLRMERQTTFPMPDLGRGLFTIRIFVDPLVERLEQEPELAPRLGQIIHSTSPAVRRYKGVDRLAEPLLAWLKSEHGVAVG